MKAVYRKTTEYSAVLQLVEQGAAPTPRPEGATGGRSVWWGPRGAEGPCIGGQPAVKGCSHSFPSL